MDEVDDAEVILSIVAFGPWALTRVLFLSFFRRPNIIEESNEGRLVTTVGAVILSSSVPVPRGDNE